MGVVPVAPVVPPRFPNNDDKSRFASAPVGAAATAAVAASAAAGAVAVGGGRPIICAHCSGVIPGNPGTPAGTATGAAAACR